MHVMYIYIYIDIYIYIHIYIYTNTILKSWLGCPEPQVAQKLQQAVAFLSFVTNACTYSANKIHPEFILKHLSGRCQTCHCMSLYVVVLRNLSYPSYVSCPTLTLHCAMSAMSAMSTAALATVFLPPRMSDALTFSGCTFRWCAERTESFL